MIKKTKLNSIIFNKCPQCHEGDFWKSGNPYNFLELGKMNETCSCCGLKYLRETGFWYGAMYASYVLGVATIGGSWLTTYLLFPGTSVNIIVLAVVVSIVVLSPLNYFLSRLIWINFFVSYDPKVVKARI